MASERQVSVIETQSKTSGFVESAAQAKALDAAFDGVTASSKALTQAEIALESSVNRLDARFDESVRAANEVARAQATIARARAQGVGTEEQYARILTNVTERQNAALARAAGGMRQVGAAANDNAKFFGLASHQVQNLGFQLNDLATSIASGGGLFRPLVQQSGQIYQALSSGPGGLGAVVSAVAASMKAVGPAALVGFGAATAAVGGTAAGIIAATAALKQYADQQQLIQRATTAGAGRLSGVTGAGVQSAAQTASGGSVKTTVAEMRNAALEIVKTGKIGQEVMGDMLGMAEDVAATFGTDVVSAMKKLAGAMADPAKGVNALADELKGFSGAQIEAVAAAQRAGNMIGAQKLALDTIRGALVNTKTEVKTWADVWEESTKKAGNAWDSFVQKIGKGSQVQLPDPEQELARIRNLPKPATRGEGAEARERAVAERIAELQKQIDDAAAKAAQAQGAEAARLATNITTALDPVGAKFREVEEQANKLRAALANPLMLGDPEATVLALESVTTAMDGATTAAEARAMALVNLQAQSNLAITAIYAETQATLARTDAERMAAAEQQAEIARAQAIQALRGTNATQQQMEIAGEIAYQQAMAQSNAQRATRMAQANEEIAQGARELAQQKLNIQSQLAYTAAQQREAAVVQAAAAAQNAYTAAIQKGYSAEQAAVLATQARTKAMAEFNARVQEAVAAANRLIQANNLQLRAITATTVAEKAQIAAEQSLISTENSLMTAVQRTTLAEQERQKVLAQSEAAMQQMIQAQEGELRLLSASISSIGMEKSAREALLAGIRAENQLKAQGIDLNSRLAQTYIQNAQAIASMTVKLERATAAQSAMNSAAQQYRPTTPKTILGGDESVWRSQMNDLNQALSGGGGFQLQETAAGIQLKAEAEKNAKAAETAATTTTTSHEKSSWDQMVESLGQISGNTANTTDAIKKVDLGDIGTEIDRLRDLQEAALSRAYKPDPYAERNPEFFYNGEKIMKEGQDRIFDGLQTQIEKLQSLQAQVGTLIAQGAQLPQTLVNALFAAGFGSIANDIAAALSSSSAPSVTPNPTAVMSDTTDSGSSTPASTTVVSSARGFTLTPEYLANLNPASAYKRSQLRY